MDREWLPLSGVKSGQLQVSTEFSPDLATADGVDSHGIRDHNDGINSATGAKKLKDQLGGDKKRSGRGDDTTSGPSSRKGSQDFLSDPNFRKGSQDSTSGSNSRKGSQDILSGPNSRKASQEAALKSSGSSGSLVDPNNRKQIGDSSEIPAGSINLNLHEAKNLGKGDLIGKSDPYAVVNYGDDHLRTKTMKNNSDPAWEFEAEIPVEQNGPRNIEIEVFDSDKLGRDKSLGAAAIDVADLLNEPLTGAWIPLEGGKAGKGEIKVSADFIPDNENILRNRRTSNIETSYSRKSSALSEVSSSYSRKTSAVSEISSYSRKSSSVGASRRASGSEQGRHPSSGASAGITGPGNLNLNIHQAKDLVKSDLIGKSDPYAVLTCGGGQVQSEPVKNSQNPKWNFEAQIPLDENSPDSFKIEIFDKDKFGKDKSLGTAHVDIQRIADGEPLEAAWLPLEGVPTGSVQLSAEFEPDQPSRKHSGLGGAGALKGDLSGSNLPEDNRHHGSKPQERPDSKQHFGSGDSCTDVLGATERNNRRNSGAGAKKLKDQLGDRRKSGSLIKDINEEDETPIGNVHLEIHQGKDLIKADLIGKSDPYVVVSYGNEKLRTDTVKNNLNPEWNYETDIPIDPNGPDKITIEVFDDDKVGRDKPLGSADVDIPSLMNDGSLKEAWLPLAGVKKGKLQVSADFAPTQLTDNLAGDERKGSKSSGALIPPKARDGMRNRGGSPRNDDEFGSAPAGRKSSDNNSTPGNIHLNIVQAKDLIKTDMIGKSDPYAVLTYGDEAIKTQTVKNNQNPEWNFEADIPYDPNYSDTVKIEIFDDDKLGADKLLGSTVLDLPAVAAGQQLDNVWLPLSGVKSGQVQISADFVPPEFHEYENVRPGAMSPSRASGALGAGRAGPTAPGSATKPDSEKLGNIKLDLLMARDLADTDLVGASDPYAIIKHGSQQFKTDIKPNTQDPEWNIQCELEVPDGNDRNISIELYDADKFGKDTFLGNLDLDIGKIMNLGRLEPGWHPLGGGGQGQLCVGADFVPELEESSTIVINQRLTESRRSSTQFHEVNLNRIPLPSTGGTIEATIRTPSGRLEEPAVQDDNNGTVAVRYQPTEEGTHYLDVRYNGEQVQGSPFKFHVTQPGGGQASAFGPGLTHGVCGEQAKFTVSTRGAGAGGLNLAVEGPSKADITCHDNKDGTVDVSYLPTAPGEYKIAAKFAEKHIPGSPFTCKITGEGKKRNQISVGSSSELQLPGNLSEADLRSLKAYIESPSGGVEQCFLKKLPRGNIGISFTPREVGEHLVSVQKSGRHITNSPFKIVVNAQEVGDAGRVKVTGEGLVQGKTHINNRFVINTKSAGYGGLSLSIEGPSKAEIDCKDNDNGTLDVDYKPTEPGFYIINIKFADSHVPGSPFQVPISGEGSEKITENIKRMREAVPVTEGES